MDTQPQMDDERERMRLDGLRALARIIARHALTHPDRYTDHRGDRSVAAPAAGCGGAAAKPARKDGAA